MSFIAEFTNLQELVLSFDYDAFEDFKTLQYVTFPQLQILKFTNSCPKLELLINFLEYNGKNRMQTMYSGVSKVSGRTFFLNIKSQ